MKKIRVAAYCRVSKGGAEPEHSLQAQMISSTKRMPILSSITDTQEGDDKLFCGGQEMRKPKKESTPVSFRLDAEVVERLAKYCETSGQTKTVAVERAIAMYINDYEEKQRRLQEKAE